jgi:hypothetical protein
MCHKFCKQNDKKKLKTENSDRSNSGISLRKAPERVIMAIAGWKTPMLTTYLNKDSLKSAKQAQEILYNYRRRNVTGTVRLQAAASF